MRLVEPRFISSQEGMILVWQDFIAADKRTLQWKLLMDEGESPVNLVEMPERAAQAQAPFDHLFMAPVNDSTAAVLQLSARGHRLLATVPILRKYAPLLAGTPSRPLIFAVSTTRLANSTAELNVHELRCDPSKPIAGAPIKH